MQPNRSKMHPHTHVAFMKKTMVIVAAVAALVVGSVASAGEAPASEAASIDEGASTVSAGSSRDCRDKYLGTVTYQCITGDDESGTKKCTNYQDTCTGVVIELCQPCISIFLPR